jgi:hypothetical protein
VTGAVTGTTVTSINCPGTCSHSYPSGTKVTLKAMQATGSAFTDWSGGGCGVTTPCTVTMSSDQSVTATFTTIPLHTLTVIQAGTGSGTVTVIRAVCPGACGPHTYPHGAQLTLTATYALGSTFTGWSGGGCSGTAECTLTMNSDQGVTATFTLAAFVGVVKPTSTGASVAVTNPVAGTTILGELYAGMGALGAPCANDRPAGDLATSASRSKAHKAVLLGSVMVRNAAKGPVRVTVKYSANGRRTIANHLRHRHPRLVVTVLVQIAPPRGAPIPGFTQPIIQSKSFTLAHAGGASTTARAAFMHSCVGTGW